MLINKLTKCRYDKYTNIRTWKKKNWISKWANWHWHFNTFGGSPFFASISYPLCLLAPLFVQEQLWAVTFTIFTCITYAVFTHFLHICTSILVWIQILQEWILRPVTRILWWFCRRFSLTFPKLSFQWFFTSMVEKVGFCVTLHPIVKWLMH